MADRRPPGNRHPRRCITLPMATTMTSRSVPQPLSRARAARLNHTASGRFVVHPPAGPRGGIDLTERVVGVIAEELSRRHGGNDVLNWIESERLLIQALLAGAESSEPVDAERSSSPLT